MRVQLYSRRNCSLCEAAQAVLERVRAELPFELQVIDIDSDETLRARYRFDIPVVVVEGEQLCVHRVDERALRRRLQGERGAP